MKKYILYLIVLALFAVNVTAVLDLNSVFAPIQVDFASFYLQFYKFIDGIIYLIFFLGVTKFVFKPLFDKKDSVKASKPLIVGVSLALTFSMIILEMNTGFNLAQLGPIAAFLFFVVLAIMLYNVINALFDDVGSSAAATFLIMYGVLLSVFKSLNNWIATSVPILGSVLAIASVISAVLLIIRMFQLIPKRGAQASTQGTGQGGGNNTGGNQQTSTTQTPTPGQNTLIIQSPVRGQSYPYGTAIPVHFNVAGPAFNGFFAGKYQYVVRIDGQTRFAGNSHRGSMKAGVLTNNTPAAHVIEVIITPKQGPPITAQADFTINAASPAALTSRINDLRNAIANINNIYRLRTSPRQNYVAAMTRIISMHRNAFTQHNPALEPTTAQFIELNDIIKEIVDAVRLTNDIITDILRDAARFALLSPTDKAEFYTLVNNFILLRNGMVQYHIDAVNAYNSHNVPPAAGP
jgi:hypothetical protein